MKISLNKWIVFFTMILLFFQNCSFQNNSLSSESLGNAKTSATESGNGGIYDGKVTLLQLASGFTCEGHPAAKSVLSRDDKGIWSLVINTPDKCAQSVEPLTGFTYSYPSHFEQWNGTTYGLNPLNSVAMRYFIVDASADPDSGNSQPGSGVCANAVGKCSLRAAFEELNSQETPAVIQLPAGTFNLKSVLQVSILSPVLIQGIPGQTILNGAGNTTGGMLVIRPQFNSIHAGDDPLYWSPTTMVQGVSFASGNDFAQLGSALHLASGSIWIGESEFNNNQGRIAVYAASGSNQVIVQDSKFHDNSALSALETAIVSQFDVERSEFYNNDLAMAASFPFNVLVSRSIFYNNATGFNLAGCGFNCLVENSTFFQNQSAGVMMRSFVSGNDGDMIIRNSTFAENLTNLDYSKIQLGSFVGPGRLLLQNSILSNAKNSTPGHVNCRIESIGTTDSNAAQTHFIIQSSIVDDNSCGTNGLKIADPKLQAVSLDGGALRALSLASDSPALDAGDNLICPQVDLWGNIRPVAFLNPTSAPVCDIGAIELQK